MRTVLAFLFGKSVKNKFPSDLTGLKFSKLLVLSRQPNKPHVTYWQQWWLCKCDCGTISIKHRNHLCAGTSKSCGCWHKEVSAKMKYKHGLHKSPENQAWRDMKARCYNKKLKNYHRYGGRGITVCKRWRNSFENFLSDVGKRPGSNYSLDRIHNDKGYYPQNVKWSTTKEQANNKQRCKKYRHKGSFLTVTQIARIENIGTERLRYNLKKFKTLPKAIKESKTFHYGKKLSEKEVAIIRKSKLSAKVLAAEFNVSEASVRNVITKRTWNRQA